MIVLDLGDLNGCIQLFFFPFFFLNHLHCSIIIITTIIVLCYLSSIGQNIGDKIPEVSMAHDASRVIENCIKYGTEEQRKTIHQALTSTAII